MYFFTRDFFPFVLYQRTLHWIKEKNSRLESVETIFDFNINIGENLIIYFSYHMASNSNNQKVFSWEKITVYIPHQVSEIFQHPWVMLAAQIKGFPQDHHYNRNCSSLLPLSSAAISLLLFQSHIPGPSTNCSCFAQAATTHSSNLSLLLATHSWTCAPWMASFTMLFGEITSPDMFISILLYFNGFLSFVLQRSLFLAKLKDSASTRFREVVYSGSHKINWSTSNNTKIPSTAERIFKP